MKKKKKVNRLIAVTSVVAILVSGVLYFSNASSFSVDKIHPGRDFPLQQVKTGSTEDIENVKAIANQEFRFFIEDVDSYLFISEDEKHALKFFKMRRITPKYWLNHIPIPWLHKKRLSKVVDRERARHETLGNLSVVFEQFRYQTGLIFLHLFKTDYLKTKVVLIDQNGKKKKVALDEVPFVLRKNARRLTDYVEECLEKEEERDAVSSLCSVLRFVKQGCQLGFSGYSDRIDMDYGFLDGRLIYLGVSSMEKDDSFKSARNTLREVFRISRAIDIWLEKNHPSLAQKFQDEMQDLLSFLEEG